MKHSLLRKGANADNIAGGRCILYAGDTWTTLMSRGITHIRIPVDMPYILPGTLAPAVVAATLARLDATVQTLAAQGFAISLCPFGAGTASNVAIIREALNLLTARYAPMCGPDQLMFELRNEPHMFTAGAWNAAVPKLIAAVRANAPLHTIVVPPVQFDMVSALAGLAPVADPNVIYTVHFYEPDGLTQQGFGGAPINPNYVFPAPPSTPGSSGLYTLAHLASRIAMASTWAARHNVPIMFGEFGCPNVAPSVQRLTWAAAVAADIDSHPNVLGWAWWSIDSKEWGLRPWKLGGAWDTALLDTIAPLNASS